MMMMMMMEGKPMSNWSYLNKIIVKFMFSHSLNIPKIYLNA